MSRKVGAIRQLSLQYEQSPAYQSRRSSLRKQHSEEIPDENLGIRISLSAKPRPIKLAWTDPPKTENQTKRPETVKDSILHPRQDLVERLRQAWQDNDKKQNLNIDLSATPSDSHQTETPKIILPLQPDLQQTDLKQIFHKQIRKKPPNNQHSESEPQRPVVVIPIIERPKSQKVQNPINIVIRPNTATSKREQFQKRNSTFNTSLKSDTRPPLLRSSSVPTKPETKPKFLASRRRLKSTKRKDSSAEEDESKSDCKKDIVTMVSLVSPSGSDNDEASVKDAPKIKVNLPANLAKKDHEQKMFSLRKTVKSVSFQQSSIHAVRSFSASFPARRGSVASTLLLGTAAKKLINHVQLNQLERTPSEDHLDPKRRLMRSHSVSELINDVDLDDDEGKELKSKEANEEQNPKEKECYDMFCKMNEKGVNVSLDTILRGMLTPTEYRLSRKQQSLDICDGKPS